MLNYYDILGVPKAATPDQIKRAYREQIKFFHPDVFEGSPEVARIKTLQLNEAYATLHDPDRRREYDFQLEYEQKKAAQGERERREKQARAEREQRQRQEAQERAAEQEEARRRAQEQAEAHRQTEEQERQRTEEESEAQERTGTERDAEDAPNREAAEPRPVSASRRLGALLFWRAAAIVCFVIVAIISWQVGRLGAENRSLNTENQRLESELKAKELAAQDASAQADALNAELDDAHDLYDRLWDDFYFYYLNIGLTFENDTTYYHNVLCPLFTENTRFGAHNTVYCEGLGLVPCPECWSILNPE